MGVSTEVNKWLSPISSIEKETNFDVSTVGFFVIAIFLVAD
jgi:hypothetical protein